MDSQTLDRLGSDLANLESELEDGGQSTAAVTVGRALTALEQLREPSAPKGSIEFAKVISVKRDGGRGATLRIDGREFPWYIHEDGVSIGQIRKDDVPRVLVPIIAERVEVIDSIDTIPATLEDEHEDADTIARSHEATARDDGDEEPGIVRPGRDR